MCGYNFEFVFLRKVTSDHVQHSWLLPPTGEEEPTQQGVLKNRRHSAELFHWMISTDLRSDKHKAK